MQPIFMIGMQRSGSNMLRLMLNQLGEIASPHPPHILQRLHPLLGCYDNLADPRNFRTLAEDVCRLVELNPVPWENVELDRDDIISRCRENSLVALHGAVYDVCAETWGAKTWCCKSLENIRYVDEIEHYFKKPKYIYLYRDGRDVALSFQKAVVGEKHIYHIAKGWAELQEIALNLQEKIEAERLFAVSYEELTGDTAATAEKLCNFLGVPYTETMLDFHRSTEAQRAAGSSTLWDKLTQPVMKDNTRKFLREATEEDIRIFESVAGHVLDKLGYDRVHIPAGKEQQFTEQQLMEFSAENQRLKQLHASNVDKDDLERRERQSKLLVDIRNRTSAA